MHAAYMRAYTMHACMQCKTNSYNIQHTAIYNDFDVCYIVKYTTKILVTAGGRYESYDNKESGTMHYIHTLGD